MHNTLLIIRREYIERIRTKAFIIMTLLMPVFMASTILVPAFVAGIESGGTQHIVLVAATPEIAKAVEHELLSADEKTEDHAPGKGRNEATPSAAASRYQISIDTNTSEAERGELRRDVTTGKIDGFIWLADVDLPARKVVYCSRSVTDFGASNELRSVVQSALIKYQLRQRGVSHTEAQSVLAPINFDSVRIEKGREVASGIAIFIASFTMVMLLYVNVLMYGFAVMRSIIEEKTSRIMEVLLSSVTATQLLAGKIIGVGAVGLTQILIWLAIAALFSIPRVMASRSILYSVHIPAIGLVAFGAFFVLGYFLYSTMYAALGAMANSDQEAQQLQWPAILPLVFSISISVTVLQHPSTQFAVWTSLVPFFAPILMFVRIMAETPPMWQIALSIALMLVTTWGLLRLSSRIYRVGILMYGKRPTLPDLRKWLKYAG